MRGYVLNTSTIWH